MLWRLELQGAPSLDHRVRRYIFPMGSGLLPLLLFLRYLIRASCLVGLDCGAVELLCCFA